VFVLAGAFVELFLNTWHDFQGCALIRKLDKAKLLAQVVAIQDSLSCLNWFFIHIQQ